MTLVPWGHVERATAPDDAAAGVDRQPGLAFVPGRRESAPWARQGAHVAR